MFQYYTFKYLYKDYHIKSFLIYIKKIILILL